MMFWKWIRRVVGLAILDRADALERRMEHNERAIDGAICAFKEYAEGARK